MKNKGVPLWGEVPLLENLQYFLYTFLYPYFLLTQLFD